MVSENIDIFRLQLKGNSVAILKKAREEGRISPSSIARMLEPDTAGDKEKLKETISVLYDTLKLLNVSIVKCEKENAAVSTKPYQQDDQHAAKGGKEDGFYTDTPLIDRYKKDVSKFEFLTHEEVLALSIRFHTHRDVEARNKMAEGNLRLAWKLAITYTGYGVELLDLIQEANLGLLRACELYREKFNSKFSTYAFYWIKQRVIRTIQCNRDTVRTPIHAIEARRKVKKAMSKLSHEFYREPTPEELKEETGFSIEKIESILSSPVRIMHLDHTQNEQDASGDDSPDSSFFTQSAELSPQQILEAKEALQEVCDEVNHLTQVLSLCDLRRQIIFRMRYGFDGIFEKRTLEDIAKAYSLTRERVRQIIMQTWEFLYAKGWGRAKNEDWLFSLMVRICELENLTGIPAEIFLKKPS